MTAVSATNTSTATNTSSSTTSSLTANFETFMTLLTAQLKAQDPLSPMDSTEFTNQLVQYSEVEQAMKTNSMLEGLTSLISSNYNNSAVSYLGKNATTTDTTATMTDGKASWNYTIPNGAEEVTLSVYDKAGNLVSKTDGDKTSGLHSFEWDGKKTDGGTVSTGEFTLKVTAKNSKGISLASDITRTGTITSVDMSGDEPKVQLGGTYISLSKISKINI